MRCGDSRVACHNPEAVRETRKNNWSLQRTAWTLTIAGRCVQGRARVVLLSVRSQPRFLKLEGLWLPLHAMHGFVVLVMPLEATWD